MSMVTVPRCTSCGHTLWYDNASNNFKCVNLHCDVYMCAIQYNSEDKDVIADTLKERGKRYGEFIGQAQITEAMRYAMRRTLSDDLQTSTEREGWVRLEPDMKLALEHICDKIARIINGDPTYEDNWLDIEGYARCVRQRLMDIRLKEKLGVKT